MLDTRGVKKRSVTSIDTATVMSALNSNDSMTSNNVVPSPMKAPAKTTTRGRGGRGARGGASTSKTSLSTTVSNLHF